MSQKKGLNDSGLLYLWAKIKAIMPTKLSELTNDVGYLKNTDVSDKLDKTGDAKDTTVTFTQAASRANITTGEKLSTMFGKIAKYLTDLKAVAFSGNYNDLSNKPEIPSDTADLTNTAGYQTADQVESIVTSKGYQTSAQVDAAITSKGYTTSSDVEAAIKAATTSVYKPAGSVAFSELPTPAAANEGNVYNVTDSFTTTTSFIEGAGNKYPAGTNVVVIKSGANYLFDVLPGFIDLSGYMLDSDFVPITNEEIDAICI